MRVKVRKVSSPHICGRLTLEKTRGRKRNSFSSLIVEVDKLEGIWRVLRTFSSMVSIAGFLFYGFWMFLVLFLVWHFFLTDRDLVLSLAENFGRPVSDFEGKVIWITGASSGLGEALAYELATVGAKLILSARREDLLERVQEKCIELSRGKLEKSDILVLSFDIANTACHKEKVENVIHNFGRIDVLINNAGRLQVGPIIETDTDVDRAVFDVNYFGPINLTKHVLRQFLTQGKGHIVVISSIFGKFGAPSIAPYTGSKYALQGYFEALRTEYQADNITVTMVCPGIFQSSLFNHPMATKKNEIIKDLDYYSYMRTDRCAHLTLVAAINKLFESWITYQPILFALWCSQVMPDFYKYVMNVIWSKRRVAEANKGKWPKDIPLWRPLFSKAA